MPDPPLLRSKLYRPRKTVPRNTCSRCGLRWVQEHGRCRQCNRALDDARRIREIQQEDAARWERVIDKPIEKPSKPPRIVVVAGEEFEVVYDGSRE